MEKKRDVLLILSFVIAILFVIGSYSNVKWLESRDLVSDYQEQVMDLEKKLLRLQRSTERMVMGNRSNYVVFVNRTVNGIAFGDYFCVWTKDRDVVSVMDTCAHEYSHNNLDMGHKRDVRALRAKISDLKAVLEE